MTLLIDDRTGSKELDATIPHGVPRTITRLQYADFAWMGNGPCGVTPIGVERKTIGDLCSCIADGRLSGYQLMGLLNDYWRVYLLVEGIWRGNPDTGILEVNRYGKWLPLELGTRRFMARDVWAFLNTLAVMCGLLVHATATIDESGLWLAATYNWWQKPWDKHKGHLQFHDEPIPGAVRLTRPNVTHRMAKEFDKVGWDKAERLVQVFPTMEALVLAGEKQLEQVPGIGKKLAKSIVRELHTGK